MRRAAAALALLVACAGPCRARAQSEAPELRPRKGVTSEAEVTRVVVDAVVKDRHGKPIPGLAAGDFALDVDGRPVKIESVEWVPADRPEIDAAALVESGVPLSDAADVPRGRLLVLFFQSDIGRHRTLGHMRMLNEMRTFLDGLLPEDLVAVASFDSHLKLRLDFTDDREALRRALATTLLHDEPEPVEGSARVSLARRLDARAARDAAYVEEGLRVLADALAPIPGGKTLLFFGWGIGVDRTPKESDLFSDALVALYRARVRVSALDVSSADFHTLEVPLGRFVEMTGGTYQKTHLFPRLALIHAMDEISGRYVVTFAKPALAAGVHRIELSLVGRRGDVHARPYYVD